MSLFMIMMMSNDNDNICFKREFENMNQVMKSGDYYPLMKTMMMMQGDLNNLIYSFLLDNQNGQSSTTKTDTSAMLMQMMGGQSNMMWPMMMNVDTSMSPLKMMMLNQLGGQGSGHHHAGLNMLVPWLMNSQCKEEFEDCVQPQSKGTVCGKPSDAHALKIRGEGIIVKPCCKCNVLAVKDYRLVNTIPLWGPRVELQFEFLFEKFSSSSVELLQFSGTGSKCCDEGDKIPALSITKSGDSFSLKIDADLGNDVDGGSPVHTYSRSHTVSVEPCTWYVVKYVQDYTALSDNRVRGQAYKTTVTVYKTSESAPAATTVMPSFNDPKFYENVNVYAAMSSSSSAAAGALIRNFHFQNKGGWILVFKQKGASLYYSSATDALEENVGNIGKNLYSILNKLEDFRSTDGKFRLKLCYPRTGSGEPLNNIKAQTSGEQCNEWRQTSNPISSTSVSGVERVDMAWNSGGFPGLKLSNDASCLLNSANNNDDDCIGAKDKDTASTGHWPGPDKTPATNADGDSADWTELYVMKL